MELKWIHASPKDLRLIRFTRSQLSRLWEMSTEPFSISGTFNWNDLKMRN